jgi:hypothetical protein
MAGKVQRALSCSRRAVCRWLGINRSTLRYQPKPVPKNKQLLEAEIIRMSREHPTLGYKKIAAKLRALGYKVNKKQVQRVRREEGLQIPPRPPRRRRQGLSTGLPQTQPCLGLGLCIGLHATRRTFTRVQPDR